MNKADELEACLDVLTEEHHWRTSLNMAVAPPHDEFITALWQVPELVWDMADELAEAHQLIDEVIAGAVKPTITPVGLVGPNGQPIGTQ